MNNIQYFHDQINGKTYAVGVDFDKFDLLDLAVDNITDMELFIGVAHKHPEDPYIKSVGRVLSKERLESIKVDFHFMATDGINKRIVVLKAENGLDLVFTIHAKSLDPHLIRIN